jgi:YbbR domain-containing protein
MQDQGGAKESLMVAEARKANNTPNIVFVKQILRKVFLEDWLIKLVALFVTLSLWLGVTGLSTPTTTRLTGIPLTLRFPSNTEITNSPPNDVDIVITGDKRRIDQINRNDLVISVDLANAQPGDLVIQLTPDNVNLALPTGVKLDEIYPNRITVRLEVVEEKEVSVVIETEGELPDGLEIYEQSVVPELVRVRGPASFIKALTSVSTERIQLSERREDFVARQVPLNLANPKAVVVEAVVDVLFKIGERRMERVLLVPIGDETGRRAKVVLFGPRSLVIGLRPDDLTVEIIRNETGEVGPKLTLPNEIIGRVEVKELTVGG